jgi:hypothetical protein
MPPVSSEAETTVAVVLPVMPNTSGVNATTHRYTLLLLTQLV